MTKSSSNADDRIINVAIVGFGLAGSTFHAPLIKATKGMKVAAVVTTNEERKRAAEASFEGIEVFPDAEAVWSQSDKFDLVVIASPNKFHAPQAMAALKAGIPVVIDKPIATTIAECEELLSTSRKTGTLLTVFQNRRWDADFLTLSKLIANGELGKINRFESRFERWRPSPKPNSWREQGTLEDAAGLLFDLGSHLIDQALTLFGAPISVYAETDVRRAGVQADDDCFVALSFPSGVRAHLWASAVVRKLGPRFRVCGMKGTFEKYGLDPQEDALRAGKVPGEPQWGTEPESAWGTLSCDRDDGSQFDGKIETVAGDYLSFYKKLRDAILHGGQPPVDPADALLTMRVIDAARRSAAAGKAVELVPR